MTKKFFVNGFVKERFGNLSRWYLEKQSAESNTKRTTFVSRRGSFSTACFLLLLWRVYTGDFCCDFSGVFKRDFAAISSRTYKLLAITQWFESPVVYAIWSRREITLEITAAKIDSIPELLLSPVSWIKFLPVPFSLNFCYRGPCFHLGTVYRAQYEFFLPHVVAYIWSYIP